MEIDIFASYVPFDFRWETICMSDGFRHGICMTDRMRNRKPVVSSVAPNENGKVYRRDKMRFLAESPDLKIYDEGRRSRRTVADAVEILRLHPEFSLNVRPTIHIGPLLLPCGDVPFLVQMVCSDLGWAVTLPSSKRFRAKLVQELTEADVQEWETPLLDGAVVELIDDEAHVILTDERRLRGVEIIPCRMPPHGSQPRELQSMRLQRAIIEHIVRMCKAEDRCYRYIDKNLLPGVRFLDFNMLHGLVLPPLAAIMHDIDLNNATLNGVSRQTVANTLKDWGLRLPPRRGLRD